MSYLKSENVRLFPSSIRTSVSKENGKTATYNPESRYTTEENLVKMLNRLTVNNGMDGSFVLNYDDIKKVCTFSLYGYYFELNLTDYLSSLINAKDGTNIYGVIRIKNNDIYLNSLEDSTGYYKMDYLSNRQNEYGILDDNNQTLNIDEFKGIWITTTISNATDYNVNNGDKYLNLLTYSNGKWIVPTLSKLKFSTIDIRNGSLATAKSILDEFTTDKLNFTNSYGDNIYLGKLVGNYYDGNLYGTTNGKHNGTFGSSSKQYTLGDASERNIATTISKDDKKLTSSDLIYNNTSSLTINGEPRVGVTRNYAIYAPVGSGVNEQYLKAVSNGVPVWQTMDSGPISGSKNAISSGAVYANTSSLKVNDISRVGANRDYSIYAPSTRGDAGQYLKSNGVGSSTPSWISPTDNSTPSSFAATSQKLVTERSIYYATPRINNSKTYNSSTSIYAPTVGGGSDFYLVGNGYQSAPIWEEKAPGVDMMSSNLITSRAVWNTTTLAKVNGIPRVGLQREIEIYAPTSLKESEHLHIPQVNYFSKDVKWLDPLSLTNVWTWHLKKSDYGYGNQYGKKGTSLTVDPNYNEESRRQFIMKWYPLELTFGRMTSTNGGGVFIFTLGAFLNVVNNPYVYTSFSVSLPGYLFRNAQSSWVDNELKIYDYTSNREIIVTLYVHQPQSGQFYIYTDNEKYAISAVTFIG